MPNTNVATPSTNRGFKDRMLSAYKLWFTLSVLAAVLGTIIVIVRTVNESNLGPQMLAMAPSQTAMQIEAVTSRLWMQLFLFSLSFAKLGIASAIYVSIKNIRARRGVDFAGTKTPFYEKFYKISPIIGSEIQTINVFVISALWAIFGLIVVNAQFAGETATFAANADRFLGAMVIPFEFFGASFSLAGLILALAAYAAEPKGEETERRRLPSGLLGFSYLSLVLGTTGFLVLFPIRAWAIATVISGPATSGFAGAMKTDAVLNLLTEQWMFIGVGGLFLAWALWLWQIAKNDHASCCLGNTLWASRIVPGLAIAGFLIVVANLGIAFAGISSTLQVVDARLAGVPPGPIMLTANKFMITASMFKMIGVGMMMAAVGLGSVGLFSYARLGLHSSSAQTSPATTNWRNWSVIAPGLVLVALVTVPLTIALINLMPQWAPVIMMGAPADKFPGFQGAFLNFRFLMAVGPGAMMLGIALTFLGAFAYNISSVKSWIAGSPVAGPAS